jgi:signal transduction histidine kinase
MSNVYIQQKSYDDAILYTKNALDIGIEQSDLNLQAICNLTIGVINYYKNDYDESLKYYQKSREISENLEDKRGISSASINIAIIYDLKGEYDLSIKNYSRAEKACLEMRDRESLGYVYSNMSYLFQIMADSTNIREPNLIKSIEYGEKAYEIAKELNSFSAEGRAVQKLYGAYKSLGNYEKALEYSELWIIAKDSMFSEEKTNALADMMTKYETEKKQLLIEKQQDSIAKVTLQKQASDSTAALAILRENEERANRIIAEEDKEEAQHQSELKEEENKTLEAQNERKNAIIWSFIIGFLLLGSLAIIVYRNYLQKKAMNKILETKNEEITSQRDEIAAQRDRLDETLNVLRDTQDQLIESEKMASLGNLVTGIAHEINTPVSIGITASSSLKEASVSFADAFKRGSIGKKDLQTYVEDVYTSSDLILKNMERTGNLVQTFKKISPDQDTDKLNDVNLFQFFNDLMISQKSSLEEKKVIWKITGDKSTTIKTYSSVLAQVINKLIQNSVKHAFNETQNPEIEIHSEIINGQLSIKYSDNGCGISGDIIQKIYDPFFTTNKQIGPGLGLHIVYNMVTQNLKGIIGCESNINDGTSFVIKLPL